MTDLRVCRDANALATTVAGALLQRLATAQSEGRQPHVALTGGTIAGRIHAETARLTEGSGVDWENVVVWFGDERFVAQDSEDRNAVQARRALLDVVGATQVHEIPSTTEAGSPEEAAGMYADRIRSHGAGGFDLVMLGVGPDGHVASLMPGQPQLDVTDRIAVAVSDSPKPPPQRVSLTFSALNRTRSLWFLVSGAEKAGAVARATAPDGDVHQTPARGITVPDTVWYVDEAAASLRR